jgi:hypothetical protein
MPDDLYNGDCTVCGDLLVEGQYTVSSGGIYWAHRECWIPSERA